MKIEHSGTKFLSLLLVGSLVVSAVALGGASFTDAPRNATDAATDEWTSDRADAARTGATSDAGPVGPYADRAWKDDPDGEPAGAVVDGDAVYLGVTTFNEYNRKNGKVVAYDRSTGAVEWNRTGLGGIEGSPAVADGTAYLAVQNRTATREKVDGEWRSESSYSTHLLALNGTDGAEEWRVDVDGQPTGLAVADGSVYLTFAPNEVRRFSAADGTLEWTERLTNGVEGSTPGEVTAPAVADGVVYVGADDDRTHENGDVDGQEVGTVHALDAATGDERWRFETAADVDSAPAVSNDSVYVGSDYPSETSAEGEYDRHPSEAIDSYYSRAAIHALNRSDGSERWSYATDRKGGDTTVRGTVPANGSLYVWTDSKAIYPQYGKYDVLALNESDSEPSPEHRLADDEPTRLNEGPNAVLETNPPNAGDREFEGNRTVVLDASNSTDDDGEIASYEWDLDGDGEFEETGERARVTLEGCSVLEVTLRVTDDDGATSVQRVVLESS